ncbi:MAG TPA: hypothetical protein VIL77_09750 [Gaiellaceae bacterium]
MRRLCLTLLCGLVAVPAALAAAHATGDGVLELSDATGIVVLNGSRGTVWGQMSNGRLAVTDPLVGDGTIRVSGPVGMSVTPGTTDTTTVYRGKNLHFRVTGGKYKLWFKGSGIDLTAVGVGSVQFTGDAFADDTGKYSLDSEKWNPVPVNLTTVRFGVQPAPAPAPAPVPVPAPAP